MSHDPRRSSSITDRTDGAPAEGDGAPTGGDDPSVTVQIEALKTELDRLLTVSLDEARIVEERIVELAQSSTDPATHAMAHRATGQVHHVAGEIPEAATRYREAIALYDEHGHPRRASRVRKTLLDALMYLGEFDEAEAQAARVRLDLDPVADAHLLGELDVNLGNVQLRRGDHVAARGSYERAISALEDAPDKTHLATAQLNLANALVEELSFDEAAAFFSAAADGFALASRSVLVAEARYGALYLQHERGEFAACLSRSRQVADDYQAAEHPRGPALVRQLRARCFLQLGFPGRAVEEVHKAVEHLGDGQFFSERARGHLILGEALNRLGQPYAAGKVFEEGRSYFLRDRNEVQAEVAALRRARGSLAMGDAKSAWQIAEVASSRLKDLDARRESARGRLIVAAAMRVEGADVSALAQLDLAAVQMKDVPDPWFWLDHDVERGEACRALSRTDECREAYLRAASRVGVLRGMTTGSELQMGLMRDAGTVYRRLAVLAHEDGDAGKALHYLDRARSGPLVAARMRPKRETSENKAIETARVRLRVLQRRQSERPLIDMADVVGRAEATLRDAYLSAGGDGLEETRGVDLNLLAARLSDEELFIEIGSIEDEWWVMAVDSGGELRARIVQDGDGLNRLLSMVRFEWGQRVAAFISGENQSGVEDVAVLQELGVLIFGDLLASFSGVKRLLIAPEGRLSSAPFAALHVDGCALIDHYEVVMVAGAEAFVLSADIIETKVDRVVLLGSDDGRATEIETEVKYIADLYGDRAQLADIADPTELLADLNANSILHVAAHGEVRTDDSLFGGLRVGGQVVDWYSIMEAAGPTGLVILSGCDSASHDARFSGEFCGLPGAFLSAGARAVVAASAPVHDVAARLFMEQFHQCVHKGHAPSTALRQGALAVREKWPHSWFWALWTVFA